MGKVASSILKNWTELLPQDNRAHRNEKGCYWVLKHWRSGPGLTHTSFARVNKPPNFKELHFLICKRQNLNFNPGLSGTKINALNHRLPARLLSAQRVPRLCLVFCLCFSGLSVLYKSSRIEPAPALKGRARCGVHLCISFQTSSHANIFRSRCVEFCVFWNKIVIFYTTVSWFFFT